MTERYENRKETPYQPNQEGAASLYLFYGDEFLVKEQVHRLVSSLLDEKLQQTNLIILDANSLELADLFSLVRTPSLFGGQRVVVVENSSFFMGRTDQKKLLSKTVEAWRSGDRKTAINTVAQLLALIELNSNEILAGRDWINDSMGHQVLPEEKEPLAMAARAWAEEGTIIPSGASETLLEELLQSAFPEGTVLIFTAIAADKRKKVFKILENRGRAVACSLMEEKSGASLDRSFFEHRVREALYNAEKTISPDAMDRMFNRSGKELRRLHSELEKLVTYVGDRREINAHDVESVFGDFHQAAFFELTNALRTADPARCLPALQDNLRIVEHPLQTLAAIATEIRRLLVARELLFTVFRSSWKKGMPYDSFCSVVKKIRQTYPKTEKGRKYDLMSMKDYPLYLYLKDAQKFPLDKLLSIMEALVEADILFKSSKLGNSSPQTILENLILTICSSDTSKYTKASPIRVDKAIVSP
jgi:DNA polymerase III subunit delta